MPGRRRGDSGEVHRNSGKSREFPEGPGKSESLPQQHQELSPSVSPAIWNSVALAPRVRAHIVFAHCLTQPCLPFHTLVKASCCSLHLCIVKACILHKPLSHHYLGLGIPSRKRLCSKALGEALPEKGPLARRLWPDYISLSKFLRSQQCELDL